MSVISKRGVDLLQGESLALFASALRGVGVNVGGTAVVVNGERSRVIFLLDVTTLATEVDDTLDVFVDVLAPDQVTWLNAIHYPQILGNGAAAKHFGILDASAPGTATIVSTSDAAVSTVRPSLFGSQYRGRYTIVDPGVGVGQFTFALTAYAL